MQFVDLILIYQNLLQSVVFLNLSLAMNLIYVNLLAEYLTYLDLFTLN